MKKEWKKKVDAIAASAPDIWSELDRLEAETMSSIRPIASFTVPEYARRHGMTRSKARVIIERLRRLGKLIKHRPQGSNLVYFTLK